jgi:hypothetical protein
VYFCSKSVEKVKASIFWDDKKKFFYDYLIPLGLCENEDLRKNTPYKKN